MSQAALAISEAHANIALIKYWGKLNRPGNYPAVPSLSLTLTGLLTRTTVELVDDLAADEVWLDSEQNVGRSRDRVVTVLDEFRRLSARTGFARVRSRNEFPTAAGLASSASGFAALVVAANEAYCTHLDRPALSAIARAASASAARSLFGGWSVLPVGADSASSLAPPEHWPLSLLVAVTTTAKKVVGSTEAMNLTRGSSPFYPAWVAHAGELFGQAQQAVLDRNLRVLGEAMEQSTLMMHATMLAARPAVVYWLPGTLNAMQKVRQLRDQGTPCYFTMDAGPHVKVLCSVADRDLVRRAVLEVDGVTDVMMTGPGPEARIVAHP